MTAALLLCSALPAVAQVGWLQYAIPPDPPRYHDMPHAVVVLGNGAGQEAPEEREAAEELDRGLGHMVAGTDLLLHRFDPRLDAIVLGTTEAVHRARLGRSLPGWTEKALPEEGFRIVHLRRGIRHWYILQGGSPRAELWAAFRFAALVAEDQQLPQELIESPQVAVRGLDLGAESGAVLRNETQLTALARLMASTGANAVVARADSAGDASHAAKVLQDYGIRLWLHADAVAGSHAQNVAGLVVDVPEQADGPAFQAAIDEANALAAAVHRPGAVMLRNALGDPFRLSAGHGLSPEQRAATLRERLMPGVIVAGPAVSQSIPLAGLGSANFGLLPGRAQAAELDVLPAPPDLLAFPFAIWQSVLQTPERGLHGDTTLLDVLRVEQEGARGALIGTLKTGDVAGLLRQPMQQANLYAFGRLAWNPALKAEAVAEEWARQTWGDDARIYGVAQRIVLGSADAFVKNSSPFGLVSLTDAQGGPSPSRASRRISLGTPLADAHGIGTDRTEKGTGEISRYPEAFAARLEDLSQCPDAWLLAVHRVPYDHPLRSGRTVAQGFYDAHFAGASESVNAVDAWEETRDLLPPERYGVVHAFLEEAALRAEIARETLTEWLQAASGVKDALGFVGSHPGRVEAEAMDRTGFTVSVTAERDDASGGALATCTAALCTASTIFNGPENVYRVETGYIDRANGAAGFELRVNGAPRAQWQAGSAPGQPDAGPVVGPAARRFVANGIRLKPGDRVELRVAPGDGATAALDFVEITRDPRWN